MIRLLVSTFALKSISALINVGITLLTAYKLGVELRGELSFFLLGIAIINMFQDIAGGPSLTYFASRTKTKPLLLLALFWILICTLILTPILVALEFTTTSNLLIFILLSILQGCLSALQAFFLGSGGVSVANWIEFTRTTLTFLPIAGCILLLNSLTLETTIFSYFIGFSGATILGIYQLTTRHYHQSTETNEKETHSFTTIFSYGLKVQLNNMSQLINYRYVYFLIHDLLGNKALGIYSVAVSIAETIWIISKSIATVYYSKIVTIQEKTQRLILTTTSFKWSGILTVIALLILLFIPESFFLAIIGQQYMGIHGLVTHLGPAIVTLSFFTILNHYFTGIDKNSINIYCSLIGNLASLSLGYLLINRFGLIGGAWTYGITHLSMLAALSWFYKKESGVFWKLYLPSSSDFTNFKNLKP